jgi:magnesium-transporting ATPase (P-type)
MEFTTAEIILACCLFIVVSFLLTTTTYRYFQKESGKREWKNQGGRTNYFRILVLVSLGITIAAVMIIKSFGVFS